MEEEEKREMGRDAQEWEVVEMEEEEVGKKEEEELHEVTMIGRMK